MSIFIHCADCAVNGLFDRRIDCDYRSDSHRNAYEQFKWVTIATVVCITLYGNNLFHLLIYLYVRPQTVHQHPCRSRGHHFAVVSVYSILQCIKISVFLVRVFAQGQQLWRQKWTLAPIHVSHTRFPLLRLLDQTFTFKYQKKVLSTSVIECQSNTNINWLFHEMVLLVSKGMWVTLRPIVRSEWIWTMLKMKFLPCNSNRNNP